MATKKKVITKNTKVKLKTDKNKQVKKKVQHKLPKTTLKLNLKKVNKDTNERQELFCQLYASDKEFFGNGVETYLEVYDVDRSKPNWYKTACAAASRLLSNVKVYTRINELLDSNGLNDTFVDKQLLFLIQQHEDKGLKIAAIREYNKLKQRILEKIEHSGKIEGNAIIFSNFKNETSG